MKKIYCVACDKYQKLNYPKISCILEQNSSFFYLEEVWQ